VQIMGGEISVASTPGQGSSFQVRMMLSAVASVSLPAAVTISGYAGRRRTILVVDDDQDHQDLMRAILEPLGFSVLTARDGPTCLALTAHAAPDLFVLDISMPGMSGWDLARTLRESAGVTAPILMLSANVGESMPAPGENDAHDGMLPKPFDLAQLLDRIGFLMRLQWLTDGAVEKTSDREAAPLVSPGARHVEELMELGRIGYVRGIEAKLSQLADDPAHQGLVQELRGHLRSFDLKRYTAVLEAIDGDG